MKKSIKEQEMSSSIQASDFINKLKQDLGFSTMGGDEVAELLLRGNKMPDTYKKEGLYIGIGKYEEDGREGLWPITIAFRFGKGNSPWKSASEEMKNELLNKRDNIIDRNYDIDVMDYSKRKMDEMVLRMNDAVIPSTAFFDFLKKYVEKFEGLIGTQTVQENKNSKVIKLTENDLMNIVQKVIEEQGMKKSPEECQKIEKSIERNIKRGERLLRLFPKPFQSIMKKSFDEGTKNGVQAFFTSIPSEIRDEVKNKFAKLRKPQTDSEIETIVVDAESGKKDVQEQQGSWRDWVWLMGLIAIILFVIWARKKNGGEYCGQSIWWG